MADSLVQSLAQREVACSGSVCVCVMYMWVGCCLSGEVDQLIKEALM